MAQLFFAHINKGKESGLKGNGFGSTLKGFTINNYKTEIRAKHPEGITKKSKTMTKTSDLQSVSLGHFAI